MEDFYEKMGADVLEILQPIKGTKSRTRERLEESHKLFEKTLMHLLAVSYVVDHVEPENPSADMLNEAVKGVFGVVQEIQEAIKAFDNGAS